mmetsp:Transcript_68673/g.173015  ORF Transcript_68673/g.173015 Transcript_68673/m.173015 type:complete len:258 (-) Transcript_68673:241-1014(-)
MQMSITKKAVTLSSKVEIQGSKSSEDKKTIAKGVSQNSYSRHTEAKRSQTIRVQESGERTPKEGFGSKEPSVVKPAVLLQVATPAMPLPLRIVDTFHSGKMYSSSESVSSSSSSSDSSEAFEKLRDIVDVTIGRIVVDRRDGRASSMGRRLLLLLTAPLSAESPPRVEPVSSGLLGGGLVCVVGSESSSLLVPSFHASSKRVSACPTTETCRFGSGKLRLLLVAAALLPPPSFSSQLNSCSPAAGTSSIGAGMTVAL